MIDPDKIIADTLTALASDKQAEVDNRAKHIAALLVQRDAIQQNIDSQTALNTAAAADVAALNAKIATLPAPKP